MRAPMPISQVFSQLEQHYGRFIWWPEPDPYRIMVGAILVQNTNWRNAQKAIDNLGDDLTPATILGLDIEVLAQSIRPSGYYNQKALKIGALTQWYQGYNFDIERVRALGLNDLRKELLGIKGVGGETADVILTYAVGKPSFVIDAYARRIFHRLGYSVPKSYEAFRELMQQALPASTENYALYHGLMVEHGQNFCRPKPECDKCPLNGVCQRVDVGVPS
ncbi:endonuclease III [Vibrio superstes NBRC 103154]|uniref:Endonuclease III n=2 Tax=Vibrio superstes TaxID=198815 RepID=A0A511QWP8_9VIBR|nr:endonuclease III [Vibrio superstes NBRC 103154]